MQQNKKRTRKPRVLRPRQRRERPDEDEEETIDPNLIGFEEKDG
jgi:hypothetical protein